MGARLRGIRRTKSIDGVAVRRDTDERDHEQNTTGRRVPPPLPGSTRRTELQRLSLNGSLPVTSPIVVLSSVGVPEGTSVKLPPP